jgi:hypothetical protein
MKIFAFTIVLLLIVSFQQTEAVAAFFRVFLTLGYTGYKLVKRSYYAKCNTRYVPANMNCPSVVYGVGLSRNAAQNSARIYAELQGDTGCGRYVGHCQIRKFLK